MASPISLALSALDRNHWTIFSPDLTLENAIHFVAHFSFPSAGANHPVVYGKMSDGKKLRLLVGPNQSIYSLQSSKEMGLPDLFSGLIKTGRVVLASTHPLFQEKVPLLALQNRKPDSSADPRRVGKSKEEMRDGALLAKQLCDQGVLNIARPLDILQVMTGKGREKVVVVYPRYEFDLADSFNQVPGVPTFSFPQIVSIQKDLASAVSKMVSAGIFCRDLKPENVLIRSQRSKDGALSYECALTDLDQCSRELVEPRRFCGTPEFMPPEYVLHFVLLHFIQRHPTAAVPAEAVELMVDKEKGPVFSLGCIYYTMLRGSMGEQMSHLEKLGHLLDQSNSQEEVFMSKLSWLTPEFVGHFHAKFPKIKRYLSKIANNAPPFAPLPEGASPLVRLVTDMLNPDPSKRPSLGEVERRLEDLTSK